MDVITGAGGFCIEGVHEEFPKSLFEEDEPLEGGNLGEDVGKEVLVLRWDRKEGGEVCGRKTEKPSSAQ